MKPLLVLFLAITFCAFPSARAEGFDDLFGDALKSDDDDLDALKKATGEIKAETGKSGLSLKDKKVIATQVTFHSAFAAAKIKTSRKEGCIPADYGRTRLVNFEFDELPNSSEAFEVCVKMESKIGRQVVMNAKIIDVKNKRVGTSKSVVDFRGQTKVSHILGFPKLRFMKPGQYKYVIEIDDKEVATFDLFKVSLDS